MADELVKIYTTDELGAALAGVMVRAYDVTGTTLITQNQSSLVGSDAIAELTIPVASSPLDVQLRLSKTGVAFDGTLGDDSKTPQLAKIYSPAAGAPTGKNDFTVQGQNFSRPAATDPRLCRASAFFRDLSGKAVKNLRLIFRSAASPIQVDEAMVSLGPVYAQTDANGWVVVDLYRTAKVTAQLSGFADEVRHVRVPDAPSANLLDLLFPWVKKITFAPTALSVGVGAVVDTTPTVVASDGRTLTGASGDDVTYTSSDEAVMMVMVMDTVVRVQGVKAGSAQLLAARAEETLVKVPATPLEYTPVPITVS